LCLLSGLSACQSIVHDPLLPNQQTSTPQSIVTNSDSLSSTLLQNSNTHNEDAMIAPNIALPTNFWDNLIADFQFDPSIDNKKIAQQRRWFTRYPIHIEQVMERASPYIYYIYQQAKQRGMPAELVLLPAIESAFDPFAYSHGRASGLWQFVPRTAKGFGLKQTWWYDGRRDIVASTNAALDYLEALHKRFDGDWLLALAAYNSGGGTVNKAIRYNRKRNRPTDFWSLKLPKETQSYVPKLIALTQVIQQPSKYNIVLPELPNQPQFAVVHTESQLDLSQAAKLAELDIDDVYVLNPGFNQWATDPDGPHHLLIPLSKVKKFTANLSALPISERVKWTRYKIKSGDSLGIIARNHHTSIKLIAKVNHIKGHRIVTGKTLMIPQAKSQMSEYSHSLEQRLITKHSTRKKGRHKQHHTTKQGDSFWKIARQYNVGTRQLAKWNNMSPSDTLRTGKRLVVWAPSKKKNQQLRKIKYKARSGDSYAKIAGKFNISLKEIQSWNDVNFKKHLFPGDRLTLYVDVTKAP